MDINKMHELPDGWVWTSLEEGFDIVLGQSPPSSTYNLNGSGLPFYQGKSEFGNVYPTPQKWCTAPKKISEKGDVLISVRAPVGPTNICSEKSCIGRGLAAIRPLNGIETFFALYLIRAFENIIAGKGTGTTFSAITGDKLKKLHVPIPPLLEQRAIVSKIEPLFSDLDNGIENFKKAQEQLKIYRQSVLKNACEGKLVPTEAELARVEGRDYEPADVLLARILKERREKWNGKGKYKEATALDTSVVHALPEGWCWAESNMICKTITDGDHQPPPQSEEGIPFLVISNIKEGKLNFNQTRFVPEYYYQSIQEHRIPKKGDILYSVVGSYGIPAMVNDDRKFCFQRHIALLKPSEFIHNKYLLVALKSDFAFKQATTFATGTAQLTVSLSGLRKIKIPLPPLPEQQRIVTEVERRLSICDNMEETIAESLQKAESLRQSILKKAFEGKLLNEKELEEIHNAPDWEPAEKLLERIKAVKTNMKTKKKGKK